jgi:tetratricopeptide (TPR) repeat protein/S1-C subfamily serine protease
MSKPTISWISGLMLLSTSLPVNATRPNHPTQNVAQASESDRSAQQVTVRITTNLNRGSGTLLKKRGNTYLVLTNAHVLRGSSKIQIQTYDGQTYTAQRLLNAFGGQTDLALIEFTSTKRYPTPEIANFTPQKGQKVYAAGYEARSGKFQSSEGEVQQRPSQSLKEGYQIGYSGQVIQGMSGGPVFEQATDELIGINGQTAYPVVASYVYEDGSKPSALEAQQMRQVNWSIPIRTVLAQVQPTILTAYQLPLPESEPRMKTARLAGWLGEIEAKAKQFTVRIDSSSGRNGSGVIVAKKGKTYTVLTAEHVVCEREAATESCGDTSYKVATHDGKDYELNKSKFRTEVGVDLAVVEFESDAVYPIATLANYPTSKSDYVFVAGFPKVGRNIAPQWMFNCGRIYEEEQGRSTINDSLITNSSDSDAELTQSQVSFSGGYEMVYTSITYGGMSGGVVMDRQGRVIGIHGLAEGESNTEEGEIQLGNSLGIPINTFIGLVPRLKLSSGQLSITSTKPSQLSQSEKIDISKAILTVGISNDNAKPSIWIERGNQLLRLGRFLDAEKAFDRAIQLNPTFVHLAWYGKGKALGYQAKYTEAISALETSLIEQSNYTPSLILLSGIYHKIKQYEKALAVLNKTIQFMPKNANLFNSKSTNFRDLKRYPEALLAIDQAIELSPRAAFYNNRGLTYYYLKEYAKAIADYDKAIAINPEFAPAYGNRGNTYHALKQYAKAIADFDRTIVINPSLADAYNNRRITYRILKEYSKAMVDFDKAIAINPKYAAAYGNRGNTYAALKDYPKAIADYNKAISINPELAEAYNSRGITYAALKDYPKAIADLVKAIVINPEYAFAYNNRGATYTALKDYPKAIADFNKAIAINPEYAKAHYNRGKVYGVLKEYTKAMADFDKAITIDPKYVEAYTLRGNTYSVLKEYLKAMADLDKAITIDPKHADAYIVRGNTYLRVKNNSKALAAFNQAITLNPKARTAIVNIGLIQYEQGNIDAAMNQFQQAINVDKTSAEGTLALAVTLQSKGNIAKAEELAKSALTLDSKFLDPAFLRKNLWGEKMISDAQILLARINKNS